MGSGYHYQQHQSQRIHEQVTLAPAQFLGPIIATHASLFTGAHRLAVQHRSAGLALSSSRLPHPLAHRVMHLRPDSLPAPRPRVMIDRMPRRQIVGQQFPCAAAANCVTDPIHDLAACMFGRTPSRFGCGHERFQAIPFGIREISIVGLAIFHLAMLGGRLFKRALSDFFHHCSTPVVPKTSGSRRTWFCINSDRIRDDLDGYAESPEAAHVVMSPPFASSLLVQTLGASERRSTFQHPIQNYEHLVGDCHNRTLLASAWSQLLEPNGEHGALFADRRPGALNQGRTQIWIAMGSLTPLLNAG